jgi:hypothetical protein
LNQNSCAYLSLQTKNSGVRERNEKPDDKFNGMMADSNLPPAKQLSANDFFQSMKIVCDVPLTQVD